MNIGDLILDTGTSSPALIIRVKPEFPDGMGGIMTFDFEVLSNGEVFCLDRDETQEIV